MKDLYEEFGELYEQHCRDIGVVGDGMVLIRDWSGTPPAVEAERIEIDWERGDYIWESDWYEGQKCEYIASFTDEEIAHILLVYHEMRHNMENK